MRFRQGLVLLAVASLAGCKVGTTTSASPSASTPSASVTQTGGPGAPPAAFRVTDLVVRADPFQVTTTCPATIAFSGQISVAGGSGTVTYRWLRSDGTQGPVQVVRVDGTGKQDVVTTWTLGTQGTRYTGWQEIEIVRPKDQVSERASFTLTCL